MPSVLAHNSSVGFCPFCGECIEGRLDCPEHELTLVSWDEWMRSRHSRVDSRRVGFSSHAVGWLEKAMFGIGALGWVVGFFMPFVTVETSEHIQFTGYRLAITRAHNLWTVLLAACVVMAIVWLRRSVWQLQRARLGLRIAAVMPMVAVAYTAWGIYHWANAHTASASVQLGPGLYIILLSSFLCVTISVVSQRLYERLFADAESANPE